MKAPRPISDAALALGDERTAVEPEIRQILVVKLVAKGARQTAVFVILVVGKLLRAVRILRAVWLQQPRPGGYIEILEIVRKTGVAAGENREIAVC